MPERVKAPGFPTAPLVETIFAAHFVEGLKAEERTALADALAKAYPRRLEEKQHAVAFTDDQLVVGEVETFYRLEGEEDRTEILLLRPEGISTCQLAPYKSWEVLFERFKRDLECVWSTLPDKRVRRLAVRSLNRIDVPVDGDKAAHEDYLALHVRVPDEIKTIGAFQLQLGFEVPEVQAIATVRSGITDPAVEGVMSFILDIDLARTQDIPEDHAAVLDIFNSLREPKNRLYRTFLTKKALEEFK